MASTYQTILPMRSEAHAVELAAQVQLTAMARVLEEQEPREHPAFDAARERRRAAFVRTLGVRL